MREACTCAPHYLCPACKTWAVAHIDGRAKSAPRPTATTIDRQAVAVLLKAYRRQHGLTREQAAVELHVSTGVLQELEQGHTKCPTPHTMQVLRETVGIPARYLQHRNT